MDQTIDEEMLVYHNPKISLTIRKDESTHYTSDTDCRERFFRVIYSIIIINKHQKIDKHTWCTVLSSSDWKRKFASLEQFRFNRIYFHQTIYFDSFVLIWFILENDVMMYCKISIIWKSGNFSAKSPVIKPFNNIRAFFFYLTDSINHSCLKLLFISIAIRMFVFVLKRFFQELQ